MKDLKSYIIENRSGVYFLYTKHPNNQSIVCQIMIDEMICKKALEFKYDNLEYNRESFTSQICDNINFEIPNKNGCFDKLFDEDISTADKHLLKIKYKQIYRKNKRFDFSEEEINIFKDKTNRYANACCVLDIDNGEMIIVSADNLLKKLDNNSISLEELKTIKSNITLDLFTEDIEFYNEMYINNDILTQKQYKSIINKYYQENEDIKIEIKKVK